MKKYLLTLLFRGPEFHGRSLMTEPITSDCNINGTESEWMPW